MPLNLSFARRWPLYLAQTGTMYCPKKLAIYHCFNRANSNSLKGLFQALAFLKRLTGPPIGLSVGKMHTMDRASAITVSSIKAL